MHVAPSPQGNDQFNGNIKGIRWQTHTNGQLAQYVYSYDRNNWLVGADFDPGANTTAYDVGPISYDANGNIQGLVRNKDPDNQNSTAMDALAYNYDPDRPNRLLWVDDSVGDAPNADDLDDQAQGNYHYNSIGQLIHDNAGQITYIYNASGLVAEVQKNGQPLVKFFYNDRNHRMRKETYFQGNLIYSTHYVRNVAGQVMAVYSDVGGNLALAEQPVYGSGRIGVAYANGNNAMTYVYELTDHLGNVRATFTKSGGNVQLEGYMDYYPFGMPMPGRNIIGDYRYNYQGQEKDDETGKEAFQLRLWDGRIGRWLTTDPAGQYDSPYLGMGNNPINGTDPDGALFLIDDWIIGGIKGLFNGEGFLDSANRHFKNSAKIWGGLYTGDIGQIASRLTWELPQTLAGFLGSHGTNMVGNVQDVSYFDGATVLRTTGRWGALTLGSYIIGGSTIAADPNNALFQHEYGHYLQSRANGPSYLFKYALPSLISAMGSGNHELSWTEQDANFRANQYFNQNHPGYIWDYYTNPINVHGPINTKWWEYPILPFTTFLNLKHGQ